MVDDDTILLLGAYLDGELSPSETLAMERRLADEPDLRALAHELGGLSQRLAPVLDTEPAPEMLRARIVRDIGFSEIVPAQKPRAIIWMAIAASLLVGVGLGILIAGPLLLGPSTSQSSVYDAVFAAHIRGLAATQPYDIASSDRHVVKPWFNGRTTIAPTAPDLAGNGFPLLGGRVDIVEEEAVPTLVYGRRRHIISVTVIAASNNIADGEERHDGSTIERWRAGNLTYLAVSDLNVAELRQFVALFKAAMR